MIRKSVETWNLSNANEYCLTFSIDLLYELALEAIPEYECTDLLCTVLTKIMLCILTCFAGSCSY